jgi:hypothetical protein
VLTQDIQSLLPVKINVKDIMSEFGERKLELQVISKHTMHQLHGASSTFVTIFALSNSYALAASFSLSMSTISLGVKKASRSFI